MVTNSPGLFAGSHVLHRLPTPRHPPCALIDRTNRAPRSVFPVLRQNSHDWLVRRGRFTICFPQHSRVLDFRRATPIYTHAAVKQRVIQLPSKACPVAEVTRIRRIQLVKEVGSGQDLPESLPFASCSGRLGRPASEAGGWYASSFRGQVCAPHHPLESSPIFQERRLRTPSIPCG